MKTKERAQEIIFAVNPVRFCLGIVDNVAKREFPEGQFVIVAPLDHLKRAGIPQAVSSPTDDEDFAARICLGHDPDQFSGDNEVTVVCVVSRQKAYEYSLKEVGQL